jgi:UDP-N-acetylglucosamine 2-epimerase (non-hydrolysing)
MKVGPVLLELQKHPQCFRAQFIHTGQHYDTEMSDVAFQDLGLPRPDHFLGVESGTHAEQTARIMVAFEQSALGTDQISS